MNTTELHSSIECHYVDSNEHLNVGKLNFSAGLQPVLSRPTSRLWGYLNNLLQNSPRYLKHQFIPLLTWVSTKSMIQKLGVAVTLWRHFLLLTDLKNSAAQLWGYLKNFIAVYQQFHLLLQELVSPQTTS